MLTLYSSVKQITDPTIVGPSYCLIILQKMETLFKSTTFLVHYMQGNLHQHTQRYKIL